MKMEQGRARTPLRAVVTNHDSLRAARNGVRALPRRGHFLLSDPSQAQMKGLVLQTKSTTRPYSYLSATIGSTRAARRAGT